MDNNRLKKLANKMVDLFPTNKFRDPQETYDIFSNVYLSQRDYFSLFKPEDILKLIFYIYSLKNTKDFKVADNLINNLAFCNLLLITTEPYEAICGACNGDGDFDCDTCYGTGESYDGGDCPKCVQGRVTCQDCDGIGEAFNYEYFRNVFVKGIDEAIIERLNPTPQPDDIGTIE